MPRCPISAKPICASLPTPLGLSAAFQRHSDCAEMAVDREMEARSHPRLESSVLPLLGRQEPHRQRADGSVRRPHLQSLSAASGREYRRQHGDPAPSLPVCTDLISIGANTILSRDIDHPRATRRSRTTSIPDRSASAPTHSSAKRASSTSTRPWRTTPSSDTHRPCTTANAFRRASTTTALRPRRRQQTIARSSRESCTRIAALDLFASCC